MASEAAVLAVGLVGIAIAMLYVRIRGRSKPPQPRGRLSDDGRWWWDGSRWISAISGDGRWRWNGVKWVAREHGADAPPIAWSHTCCSLPWALAGCRAAR